MRLCLCSIFSSSLLLQATTPSAVLYNKTFFFRFKTGSRSNSYPLPGLLFLSLPSGSVWRACLSFCRFSAPVSDPIACTTFSAIIRLFSSPGLWKSSLSLTHTILLKTFLSPSGSSFVLMFKLHDRSLKCFLDTAIISSSPTQFTS